jgi:hypothetical protein
MGFRFRPRVGPFVYVPSQRPPGRPASRASSLSALIVGCLVLGLAGTMLLIGVLL